MTGQPRAPGRRGAVLVYGLGVSGTAAVRRLLGEGRRVLAADDDPGEGPRRRAAELGVDLVVSPDASRLGAVLAEVEEVVVSPGVPATHRVLAQTQVPVVGEIELAFRLARMPIVAVTGTNGKTTVVTLVEAMLETSGHDTVAAGNIGLPLLEAVDRQVELVVAEVSSFQLALTSTFRPAVSAWVNFSADHLDWHPSLDHYRASKARLWANVGKGDTIVVNCDDPVVMAAAVGPSSRGASVSSFGLAEGDYRVATDSLVGPNGALLRVEQLPRAFPHDISDALCAWATAVAAGASDEACGAVLSSFTGLPHRVQLVGEAKGVRYYDDSKATTPGAVLAALGGFDSVVLVAGGRNKGLDLSSLRTGAGRLRAVVAIGEAAGEVENVFEGAVPVHRAGSMEQAVRMAGEVAVPGDAVVLSPACASFDWYRSYGERGDDFARCVVAITAAEGTA